jgi:uncharacterized protein YjbI with pentapeptide repeats
MTDNVPGALQPNTLSLRGNLTGSTLVGTEAAHSLVSDTNFFNSLFHNSNLQGITYNACEFDGSLFDGCSLRGVELRNCDVEGLIINGVKVGALLQAFLASDEVPHVR